VEPNLREKFYGCIAGVHVGSAMGAVVEGWNWDRTEATFGTFFEMRPYAHYDKSWERYPGTTEDGVERQKLMITAIIEKQDRITAEDLKRTWIKYMNPQAPGKVSEPFEAILLAMARADIPGVDIGKYCDYSGLCALARACHPIGLINAGDIRGAIEDINDVGLLYQTANSSGIRWAEVTVIGLAAATMPGATVESVLAAIFEHADPKVVRELQSALAKTKDCTDFRELRTVMDTIYFGEGIPYWCSYANEVVTKGICVFRMCGGDLKRTMMSAVNMGRDTDCCCAIAAGLAGAVSGISNLPPELIEQTDYATTLHPYTSSKRTIRETSDGLYEAYVARWSRLKSIAATMESSI
jgi:ADP-ribosylglycohydrolase